MSGVSVADELEAELNPERLRDLTLDLVKIRSYPGEESELAYFYGRVLRDAGLDVELDQEFPESPSVIARLHAGRSGPRTPTLQLAGHMDTVAVEHEPASIRDGYVTGRGACDMKAGLAAMAEVATILARHRHRLEGDLLITSYGQHEAAARPVMHAPLLGLLGRGIKGDAAIVCEGPNDSVPVIGKGATIFEIHLSRPGDPEHEILHSGDLPNPVMAAHRFVTALLERPSRTNAVNALLGPDSVFIGAIRGGDLYNRIPVKARIDGTRRYAAPGTFEQVRSELEEIGRAIAVDFGIEVEVRCLRSGQPFEIDPNTPIIESLRGAYSKVTGDDLKLGVQVIASDLNHLFNVGHVPVAAHGANLARAHATPEYVSVADILRSARVYLRTVLNYFSWWVHET